MNILRLLKIKRVWLRLLCLALVFGVWLVERGSDLLHAQGRATSGVSVLAVADQACDCKNASFSIRQSGGESGVGNKAIDFAIKNTGSGVCCLNGYPHLDFLDDLGRPVSMDVKESASTFFLTSAPADKVVLKPGAEAYFQMAYSSKANGDNGCSPIQKIRVKLPGNESVSLEVSSPFKACNGQVTVSPIYLPGKRK